jgi:hypothetical protein
MSNRTLWARLDTTSPGTQWGLTNPTTLAYTSGSGNVALFACARNIHATADFITSDWAGDAMASLAQAKQNTPTNLTCAARLKTGGVIGAGTMTATHILSGNRMRHLLGWAFDLNQVNGGVGGANATVLAVTQSFVEVSLPVAQAGSLLVAAAWCQNEDVMPFSWSAGWTPLDSQILGAGDQPCGSIASKISTASGSELVRMSGTVAGETSAQWAMAATEFLPG